jgi:DNA replication and repair protein RecF
MHIQQLQLHNFRNHQQWQAHDLPCNAILLTGCNGSGKTSVLEAISLLNIGRGLRNANYEQLANYHQDNIGSANKQWLVRATIKESKLHKPHNMHDSQDNPQDNQPQEIKLATGCLAPDYRRVSQFNGEKIATNSALNQLAPIIWLAPHMYGLFAGSPEERRRFIDRLSYHHNKQHSQQVNAYNKANKQRNQLLKQPFPDSKWLNIIAQQMAESCWQVIAMRVQAIDLLQQYQQEICSSMPRAKLEFNGRWEQLYQQGVDYDEFCAQYLAELAASKYPYQSFADLEVYYQASDIPISNINAYIPARFCSTGEQKSLLMTLILAQVKALLQAGEQPILLLDEVAAHLDQQHRSYLLNELRNNGIQSWLTSTEAWQGAEDVHCIAMTED